jgi:hypothetical protein
LALANILGVQQEVASEECKKQPLILNKALGLKQVVPAIW